MVLSIMVPALVAIPEAMVNVLIPGHLLCAVSWMRIIVKTVLRTAL